MSSILAIVTGDELLLTLAVFALAGGIACAFFALGLIIRPTPDPVADALNAAEALLVGTGITLPDFIFTREDAREAILAAVRECGRMEYRYLSLEAAVPEGMIRPNDDTAAAMRAYRPLSDIARSL